MRSIQLALALTLALSPIAAFAQTYEELKKLLLPDTINMSFFAIFEGTNEEILAVGNLQGYGDVLRWPATKENLPENLWYVAPARPSSELLSDSDTTTERSSVQTKVPLVFFSTAKLYKSPNPAMRRNLDGDGRDLLAGNITNKIGVATFIPDDARFHFFLTRAPGITGLPGKNFVGVEGIPVVRIESKMQGDDNTPRYLQICGGCGGTLHGRVWANPLANSPEQAFALVQLGDRKKPRRTPGFYDTKYKPHEVAPGKLDLAAAFDVNTGKMDRPFVTGHEYVPSVFVQDPQFETARVVQFETHPFYLLVQLSSLTKRETVRNVGAGGSFSITDSDSISRNAVTAMERTLGSITSLAVSAGAEAGSTSISPTQETGASGKVTATLTQTWQNIRKDISRQENSFTRTRATSLTLKTPNAPGETLHLVQRLDTYVLYDLTGRQVSRWSIPTDDWQFIVEQ